MYLGPYVFENDFPALAKPPSSRVEASLSLGVEDDKPAFITEEQTAGECRVICFDHRHNKTLADLKHPELRNLLAVQQREYSELAARYRCVTLFENKGGMMGCSQPHPHGQIWAHDHLSTIVAGEDRQQKQHFDQYGSALLADYQAWESRVGDRTVFENSGWLVVVPYWAAWPYETLVMSKGRQAHFGQLLAQDLDTLAEVLSVLARCYDALFNCPFPYSMGWHNAPTGMPASHWRLHAHFFPPLLRSATVKKHMVGYEMLGEPQRDLTPESAAAQLRPLAADAVQLVAGDTW